MSAGTEFRDGDVFGIVGDDDESELPPVPFKQKSSDSDVGAPAGEAFDAPRGDPLDAKDKPGVKLAIPTGAPSGPEHVAHQRRRTAGLVVLGGLAALGAVFQFTLLNRQSEYLPSTYSAEQLAAGTPASILKGEAKLFGPGGPITLPYGEPVVVNVWLEGCADCMDSFEAYRDLHSQGGLNFGAPVINVAFGSASREFAERYGVDENLVFDSGASLVQPLGIGTFTTLVMDADGNVVERALPRFPNYAERVRSAIDALTAAEGE